MNIISLIQPHELGDDFYLDQGVWKINFPTTATPPPPISNDARNIIKNVADGMFVDQRDRLAYAMVQDNQTQKIQLWQFPADSVFDIATATMVSEIDMLAMNGQFDDIAIDEGVVTFTDVQSGLTLTLNTNELQRVGSIKSSSTIAVTETAGVLKMSVKVDPKESNLFEVTTQGMQVSTDRIDTIFGDKLAAAGIHIQSMARNYDGISHVIGDQIIDIPKVQLVNTAGEEIALVNNPYGGARLSSYYSYPDQLDIENFRLIDGLQENNSTAFFSMKVNGQSYFTSKPDLFQEDFSIIPGVDLYLYNFSGGNMRLGVNYIGNVEPIHVVLSASDAQKVYTRDFFSGPYRGAKVLPNGDLEFVLVPREPS